MNRFSPLRYPGGKGKLSPYLTKIITLNGLEMGHYAEPFAGGAAVALDLLFSERVRHIHINDIDPCVYAFWHSVVHNMEAMIERIEMADISIETWLAARETKRKAGSQDLLDLGFATFFLSRTNRSGILNGGVIGGLAQEGAWKIDCRFNKEELISRIRRIGFYKSRISVCNMDASLFLSNYVPDILGPKLLYIDPPYYVKGALLYQNHYKHDDHLELAKLVANLENCCWVVSYDNVKPIAEMYSSFDQEIFSIDYTARTYAKGTEIMVFSPDLNRPAAVFCNKNERRMLENA